MAVAAAPTFGVAVRQYTGHLNRLLAGTVTETRLVVAPYMAPPAGPPRMQIAFRRRGVAGQAPLRTGFGRVGLYIGQVCEDLVMPDGRHGVLIVEYGCTLTPEGSAAPLLRWEYVRRPARGSQWCRHHLQGPVPLTVGQHSRSLDDWHLPTGYVPLEEILRFCIVDLGVKPKSRDWDAILQESHERFQSME